MSITNTAVRSLAVALLGTTLIGCSAQPDKRINTGANLAQFDACFSQALAIEASAHEKRSTGGFKQTARTLEQCLATAPSRLDAQRGVTAYAVLIRSLLVAGEIDNARNAFYDLQMQYPNRDLYTDEHASVLDTLAVLLGEMETRQANLDTSMQSELKRVDYWQAN